MFRMPKLFMFVLCVGLMGSDLPLLAVPNVASIPLRDHGLQTEGYPLYMGRDENQVARSDLAKSVWNIQRKRTPARHVGAVMAILATFDQAQVLPPESSPQANHLIRSLIQFQSAFMDQQATSVQQYLTEALRTELREDAGMAYAQFSKNGWTSTVMEAVVDYSATHTFWENQGRQDTFSRYNLSPSDWGVIVEVFTHARDRFRAEGKNFHEIFAAQRLTMPGGK